VPASIAVKPSTKVICLMFLSFQLR
jgi:hypothetical protein